MIVGSLAVVLNLLSVALLAFFIGVLLLSLMTSLMCSKLSYFTFRTRKFVLWTLVTAPWWIGLMCVALFWPNLDGGLSIPWLSNFAHWHHEYIFTFTSWHGLTLFISSLVFIWLLTVIAVQYWKKLISMRGLLELSNTQDISSHNSYKAYILQSNIPTAFTAGLMSPKIYVTSALQQQVNQQELDIIIQHELAHARAYDPLCKVIFTLFCRFYPKLISCSLMQHYNLLTEQMADSAVTHFYDSLDVAQTLINVARLQQNMPIHCDGAQLSYFGNEQINQRVLRLVSPIDKTPLIGLLITITAFIAVPVITASTIDSFHHFIETFFTH